MQRCDSGIFLNRLIKCVVFSIPTAALTSRMVRVVVRSSVRAAFSRTRFRYWIGGTPMQYEKSWQSR